MVCGFVRFNSYSLSRVYIVEVRPGGLLTTFPTLFLSIEDLQEKLFRLDLSLEIKKTWMDNLLLATGT